MMNSGGIKLCVLSKLSEIFGAKLSLDICRLILQTVD